MPKQIRKEQLFNKLGWKKECAICKITEWMGQPIKLKINHINGSGKDNRIENIRLLCYNCHSQTRSKIYKEANINETE